MLLEFHSRPDDQQIIILRFSQYFIRIFFKKMQQNAKRGDAIIFLAEKMGKVNSAGSHKSEPKASEILLLWSGTRQMFLGDFFTKNVIQWWKKNFPLEIQQTLLDIFRHNPRSKKFLIAH